MKVCVGVTKECHLCLDAVCCLVAIDALSFGVFSSSSAKYI